MATHSNGNGSTVASAPDASALDADPPLFAYGPRPPVTRLRRRSVVLIAVAAGGLALAALTVTSDNRGAARPRDGAAEESAIRPAGPVESVQELPPDYAFMSAPASTGSAATRPALPSAGPAGTAPDRQLTDREQKEQQAAYDSPLVFARAVSPASSGAAGPTATGPAPTSAGVIASVPADAGSVLAPVAPQTPDIHQQREAFLARAGSVEPVLNERLRPPVSPYELKAGSVIPAALVTAINTDLPGDVIAQVTENVYDSATGDHLLVPQGARLLGRYQSLVGNGQNRALLAWQRLIYPDGRSIALGGMPGTDEAGASGVADRVDYHLDKLAAATALSTAIAYGGNLARGRQGGYGGNYGSQDVIGDTVAQQADRVGSRIIDRQLDVQPTITVRQGWPLRVLVNKDLVLAPYDRQPGAPSNP